MADENTPPLATGRRKRDQMESALRIGARKRICAVDPLLHHGRHFGRTVHAMTNMKSLLFNGIQRLKDLTDSDQPLASETEYRSTFLIVYNASDEIAIRENREHSVFVALLNMVSGLEGRLMASSDEEVSFIADLIQRGAASARLDDTKSLKGAVLDWITPKGQSLDPPLARNVKSDRGFHHERTGALLCPTDLDWSKIEVKEKLRDGELVITGDQWPVFIYHGYNCDSADPWNGLFRSTLLVMAYKHIFTSPSSVEKEPKATRSGNARIHGMTQVTPASIAYIATQVRFALTSSPIFSRTDTVTDSETFYSSILDLFDDPDEKEEVTDLLTWWNRQIFPSFAAQRPPPKNSLLAKIKERRAQLKGVTNRPSEYRTV